MGGWKLHNLQFQFLILHCKWLVKASAKFSEKVTIIGLKVLHLHFSSFDNLKILVFQKPFGMDTWNGLICGHDSVIWSKSVFLLS